MSERFGEWNCNTCTSNEKLLRDCRRPDYKGEKSPAPQIFRLRKDKIEGCPLSHIDWGTLSDALDCESYWSQSFLPEEGTILDQTEFFTVASKMVLSAKSRAEADRYEEMKNKK